MSNFIMYRRGDGEVKAMPINESESFEDVAKEATQAGVTVLLNQPMQAVDAMEAVAKFQKAQGLRAEGADLAEKAKKAPEQTQKSMDEIEQAKTKQEAFERAGRLGANRPESFGEHLYQVGTTPLKMAKAGLGLGKDLVSKYAFGDDTQNIGENFADRLVMPWGYSPEDPEGYSEIGEATAGDPTLLIPSPVNKLATVGKVGKAVAKTSKPAQAIGKGIAEGAYSGALSNLGSGGDLSEGAEMGALGGGAIGSSMYGLGSGSKALGKKLIQGVVKPKTGSDVGQDLVGELMASKTVEGKNVIKPFSSVEKSVKDIYSALDEWQNVQAESIPDVLMSFREYMSKLRNEYVSQAEQGKIDADDLNKLLQVIDKEEQRFLNAKTIGVGGEGVYFDAVPAKNIHNAKVDVGQKSRFDLQNPDKIEPIQREAYRDAYGVYSEALGGIDGAPSKYQLATKAMAPIVRAKEPVEKALERTSRNNLIPLSSAMLASGALASDTPEALILSALPWALQSMPTGTALYRGGESLRDRGSKYAIPLGVRLLDE